jgi:glycosyltransferase involved in cell wall biosynthesis
MDSESTKIDTYKSGLVSIVIPTFNRKAYLLEAIRSAINQTYRPIECIIVDDGSTDNTKELVEAMATETSEGSILKYISQPNSGAQVARNCGTAAATGAFIQYLDSDDILYPDKIQQQVNYLMQHKECDGVFGDWQIGSVEKNETVVAYKDEDLITQMLTKRCIANFSFLMRRTIVQKIGDWDVNIKRNQEIDFHLRGVLAGGKFDYQPGLCGLWRQHVGDRIASTQNLHQTLLFFEKWQMILGEKNMLNHSLAEKLANLYKWLIEVNPNSSIFDVVSFYRYAKKIMPSFRMFKTGRYFLISRIAGEENALRIWQKRRKSND